MIGRPAWTAGVGSRRVEKGVRVTQGYPDRAAAGRRMPRRLADLLRRVVPLLRAGDQPDRARLRANVGVGGASQRSLPLPRRARGRPRRATRTRPGGARAPGSRVDAETRRGGRAPADLVGGPVVRHVSVFGGVMWRAGCERGRAGGSSIASILPGLLRHPRHEAGAEHGSAHRQVAPEAGAGPAGGPYPTVLPDHAAIPLRDSPC